MNHDRRTNKRYKLEAGTYASLAADLIVGPVEDLSVDGVSFTYVAHEKTLHSEPVLQIFSKQNNFHLKHIRFRIISETNVINPNPCSSLLMKRVRGSFLQLTQRQKFKLEMFIEKFAKAEA